MNANNNFQNENNFNRIMILQMPSLLNSFYEKELFENCDKFCKE